MPSKPELEARVAELEKEVAELNLFLADARAESSMYDQGRRVERQRWLNEVIEVTGEPGTENQEACRSLLHGHRYTFKDGQEAKVAILCALEARGQGPLMPWGKFKGRKMGDLPCSYVLWLLEQLVLPSGRGSPASRRYNMICVGAPLYALFVPPDTVERKLDRELNELPDPERVAALKWAAQQEQGKYLLAWLGWSYCRLEFPPRES